MKNFLISTKIYIGDGERVPGTSLAENRNRVKPCLPRCDNTTSTSRVGSGISCISAASVVTVTDNDNRIEHKRKTKK